MHQQDRDDDVGGADRALDEEDGAVQLEGVEAAEHQVVHGEEHDAGPEQDHRRHVVVEGGRGRAVPEQHLRGVVREQGEGEGERDDDREGGAQSAGEGAGQAGQVAVVGLRREAGQDRGGQRDGDDRVRDHHEQERRGVDRVAGGVDVAAGGARLPAAPRAVPPEASRTTTV